MITTRARRALAATASTAVAAAGLAALAPAAQAAPTSLTFNCSVSILTGQVFKLDVTPTLPTDAPVGSSVNASFAGNLTVPASTVGAAYSFLNVRSLEGSASIRAKVGGQESALSASVPSTTMPASGELVIPVTASGKLTTGATPGKQDVTVSGFTAPLVMKKADNSTQDATVECTADAPTTAVGSINAYDPASPLGFNCSASILADQKFALAVSAVTPAKAEQGKATQVSLKGTVTVPASTASTAVAFLAGKSLSGPTSVNATIGGAPVTLKGTLPSTAFPASGDMSIPVTATASWTPKSLGSQSITVPGFTAALTLLKTDGTTAPVAVDCKADIASRVVGSVEVVKAAVLAKAASKTTAKVKVSKKSKKATVSVKVTAKKKAATGKVKLTIKKGKKTVSVKTVSLKKGKVTTSFKKKLKKGSYTLTASYKGNKSTKTSKKVVKFRVR